MRHRGMGIAFVALLAAACGRTGEAELPAAMAVALAEWTDLCREAEGTPHADDAVRRIDFNGDGIEDYVLFVGWIVCENAWSIYGERERPIWAGVAGDVAAQPFNDAVYDAKFESRAGATELWLTVSAGGCGRPRAEFFSEESFCDRQLVWNAAAGRLEYAPLSQVRMIE